MEILKLVAFFQLVMYWILKPYFYLKSLRKTQSLPRKTAAYVKYSVVEIARKIREGKLKSRDAVDKCIEAIKKANPVINAIVEERFFYAQQEADKVDAFIAANLKSLKMIENETPLLGVPFTVKESCGLKGMSQAIGCLPRKGTIAADDGGAVKELRKAGAIPLAVTNTPEFGYCWETNNLLTGRTLNPYDLHRTSGGSSGGEGAIIGVGASLFGIGSDLGGSIRIPAMFNGIFGHKPSPGFVSLEGHFPNTTDLKFHNYLVIGPLTRFAEDLSLILKVMCGDKAPLLKLDEKIDLSKLKVYFMEEADRSLVSVPVDKEIKNRMKDALLYLKTVHCCQIEKGKFMQLANSAFIGFALLLSIEGLPKLTDFSTKKKKSEMNVYLETLKSIFGLSEYSIFGSVYNLISEQKLFSKKMYNKYYNENEELKTEFKKVLKDDGVLLYPTFPLPAIHHNEIFNLTNAARYSMIVNTLGLPATHVPLGLNKNGLPIGIQVIAGENQDRLCIAVAKALEERFGGWIPPF